MPSSDEDGRRLARSATVTGIAQIAMLGLGAAFAIVILLEFGRNRRTDGVLAAYGVYSVVVLFAQSFRTTAVARLVEDGRPFAAYDRFLGGVLVVFLGSGIAFVALGSPLASLLTGDLGPQAHDAARFTLALLWPAAGAQLVSALTAALLGARGEFALPGAAFVIGTLTQIALVLGLAGPLGHDAVAVGVAAGAALTCTILLARMATIGYRPSMSALRPRLRTLHTLAQMLGGAAAHLAGQLTYLVSLAFAARIGAGAVTLYSYAFFATSAIVGATAGSLALVLAAPIAESWNRDPRTLAPHMQAVARAVLLVLLPLLGVIALVGAPAIELLLGSSLSHADAVMIVGIMLAMSGMMLGSAIEPVPMLAAFATSRYGRVALLVLGMIVVQIAAATVALLLHSLVGLGIAASIGSLTYVLLLLQVIYGRRILAPIVLVGRELAALLVPAAAIFVPAGFAATFGSRGWDLAAAILACALYGLFVRARRPEHWALLLRVIPIPASRRTS
jgi:peptidoglycan biosynthesis protein MviN/MurJ (putative lipid II flippase)